ncbi:hypothetical protein GVAV_002781 [Gurleya vavrai]
MNNVNSEIENALQIEDPISQSIQHKKILQEIDVSVQIYTPKLQEFLLASFGMFHSDDECYDLCVQLLLSNVIRLNLQDFKDIIVELLGIERFVGVARDLIREINSVDTETKRVKKVSFNETSSIRYIEVEVDDIKDIKDDRAFERKTMDSSGHKKIIEFKRPFKLNVSCFDKKTEETQIQEIRENDNILFVNDNINQKFEPSELKQSKEILFECVDLPLINLNVKNIWKNIDFVKINENKEFDLKEILNDPKILDEFM